MDWLQSIYDKITYNLPVLIVASVFIGMYLYQNIDIKTYNYKEI